MAPPTGSRLPSRLQERWQNARVAPSEEGLGDGPGSCHLYAGWMEAGLSALNMPHYVAIVEEAGPEKAVGIWFPDLPGCFSAGDDVDEALRNAEEALALYAEAEANDGRALPT